MHVAQVDLRATPPGRHRLRFAMLGQMAYVFAEIPASGTAGTSLEQPCSQAHWGFVIEGELTFVTATTGARPSRPVARSTSLPAVDEHWFESAGPALVAGFQPIEADVDVSDERLAAQGFELVARMPSRPPPSSPAVATRKVPAGQIRTESWPMSSLPHDPRPDGGAERLHVRLVRRAALGPRHRGSLRDRVGG